MAKLLDVNLTIAILHTEHGPLARSWLAGQTEMGSLLICRATQMGVLRLLTRRAMMRDRVLEASEAWSYWRTLRSDERFRMVDEPVDLEEAWTRIGSKIQKGACLDTDTYLAAFALAGGHTLATFDGGFVLFEGLATEIL